MVNIATLINEQENLPFTFGVNFGDNGLTAVTGELFFAVLCCMLLLFVGETTSDNLKGYVFVLRGCKVVLDVRFESDGSLVVKLFQPSKPTDEVIVSTNPTICPLLSFEKSSSLISKT